MDVLKEEPSFSHDHFSEVKAASTGQAEPANTAATSGRHKAVAVVAITNMIVSLYCMPVMVCSAVSHSVCMPVGAAWLSAFG